jgi:hypothetical protein
MLQEETLMQMGRRLYEEPEGEFLEMIGSGSNTITVLTRVDSDKAGKQKADLPDPFNYSVSELEDELRGLDMTDGQREYVLQKEIEGKDRKTAKAAISES